MQQKKINYLWCVSSSSTKTTLTMESESQDDLVFANVDLNECTKYTYNHETGALEVDTPTMFYIEKNNLGQCLCGEVWSEK